MSELGVEEAPAFVFVEPGDRVIFTHRLAAARLEILAHWLERGLVDAPNPFVFGFMLGGQALSDDLDRYNDNILIT